MIASASVPTPTAAVDCFAVLVDPGWRSTCPMGTTFSGLLSICFIIGFGKGGFIWSRRMTKLQFFWIF